MKYIVKDSKLFSALSKMVERMFPELELPLRSRKRYYDAMRGVTSFQYSKVIYHTADGEPLFVEFSDNHPHEKFKWEVNDKLKNIFDIVGEELFISFVKEFFGIDITEKGNKKYDWVFR